MEFCAIPVDLEVIWNDPRRHERAYIVVGVEDRAAAGDVFGVALDLISEVAPARDDLPFQRPWCLCPMLDLLNAHARQATNRDFQDRRDGRRKASILCLADGLVGREVHSVTMRW